MSRTLLAFLFLGLAAAFTDATDFERNLRQAPAEGDTAMKTKFAQGLAWLKMPDNFPAPIVNKAAGSLLSELMKEKFIDSTTVKPIRPVKMEDKEAFIAYFKKLRKSFPGKSPVGKAAKNLRSAFIEAEQSIKRRFVKALTSLSGKYPSAKELLTELRKAKFAKGSMSSRIRSRLSKRLSKGGKQDDKELKVSDPLFSKILNYLADNKKLQVKSVNTPAQKLIEKLRAANVGFVDSPKSPGSPAGATSSSSPEAPSKTPPESSSKTQPPSPAAQSGRGLKVRAVRTTRTTTRRTMKKSYCC